VDISILTNNIKDDIKDIDLLNIIVSILTNKKVSINNTIIEEDKGIMAGIPLSAFLANYFIKDIDKYFKEKNVLYLRYSDDIILFTNTKEEVVRYSNKLKDLLQSYN
jgi:retron-type reverse transcriptase